MWQRRAPTGRGGWPNRGWAWRYEIEGTLEQLRPPTVSVETGYERFRDPSDREGVEVERATISNTRGEAMLDTRGTRRQVRAETHPEERDAGTVNAGTRDECGRSPA